MVRPQIASHTGAKELDSARKTVLLIGAGERIRREYAVEALAAAYNILLIEDEDITWQSAHVVAALSIDQLSGAGLTDAAAAISDRYLIDGIVTWADYALEETAALAEQYRLPYTSVDSVRQARDKHATRQRLAAAGVPSPRSRLVHDLAAALKTAEEFGYPVVFKPRNLGGSAGVCRVAASADAEAAYADASEATGFRYDRFAGILVEELLVGPEISVETATVEGKTEIIAVTRKETGFDPYFIETGHTVSADDPLAWPDSPASTVARAALSALDITYGVSHVEMILTASGPKIVEVNARLAGDLIPYLVALACRRDLSLIAAQIAVGDSIEPMASGESAAIAFFHPPRTGTLRRVEAGLETAAAPWLRRADLLVPTGAAVTLPPDGYPSRVCLAIVSGPDSQRCRTHLDSYAANLRIDVS